MVSRSRHLAGLTMDFFTLMPVRTYYSKCKGMAGFKWLKRNEETKESVRFLAF